MEWDNMIAALSRASVPTLCLSALVFAATMLLKLPIKKHTSLLEESKRKAVNSWIIVIPIVLSFGFTAFYDGVIVRQPIGITTAVTAVSVWALTFSLYAIFNRLVIIVKGIASGNFDAAELQKEADRLASRLKDLAKVQAADETQLESVARKIAVLRELKQTLETSADNLPRLAATNTELQTLTQTERALIEKIAAAQSEIEKTKQENVGKSTDEKGETV